MQTKSATKVAENTFFIICNACFWCASLLGARTVGTCPFCNKAGIEVLPLAVNKGYAFDCNAATGVTLEFSPKAHGTHAA